MVKYHKDIVKEASHFYAKAKYEGHLDQVTNEIQAILDGIQNTSTFRQLMHLEHVSYDKKLAVLESTFGHLSSETQEYLATFPSEDGSMNIVEALEAFLELYNANKLEIVSAIPLTDEQIEQSKKDLETAKESPALGFIFNTENVKSEITALTNTLNQFTSAINTGTVDPEVEIPKMLEKLKSEGAYQKVLDEIQKQYDEYLAAKK